jgi:hypothetical protein
MCLATVISNNRLCETEVSSLNMLNDSAYSNVVPWEISHCDIVS